MAEKRSIDFLTAINEQLASENQGLKAQLQSGSTGTAPSSLGLLAYRMDQSEKRSDAVDARMVRIEDKLNAIQLALAGLATSDTVRNWTIALAAVVIATGLSVGAILLQSSGNQLSAFQAGLSAIQAVTAATQIAPPQGSQAPVASKPGTK
jgi:hypothetical protein